MRAIPQPRQPPKAARAKSRQSTRVLIQRRVGKHVGVGISPSQIDVPLPVLAALDEINEVQWLKHMNWLCIVKVGQSC